MPRVWIDTMFNNSVVVGSQITLTLMTDVTPTQTRQNQMTLLRTVIGLDIGRLVHDSGEGSERMSLGIGIASQEAFAAGAISDANAPTDFPTRGWVWRSQYRVFGFAADQPTVFTRRIDLDIRAMRKLENGEAFLHVTLEAIEGVSSSAQVVGIIRQLWLVS